jgi:hypothetical protein
MKCSSKPKRFPPFSFLSVFYSSLVLLFRLLLLSTKVEAAAEEIETEEKQKAAVPLPSFPPLTVAASQQTQFRRIFIPPHRKTPLRDHWMEIAEPIVQDLKLQMLSRTGT